MESPHQSRVRYIIYTKIKAIFKEPLGWFIHLEGSWESICLGMEEPDFIPGDPVKITLERQETEQ